MTLWARTAIVCRLLLASLLMVFAIGAAAQQTQPDTEQLGKALEYFQDGKYHESLLIFQGLDKRYKLNPRFRAYIGLCYYKEWNYKKAVEYFDRVLPLLGGLAPHELSVYYYAARGELLPDAAVRSCAGLLREGYQRVLQSGKR